VDDVLAEGVPLISPDEAWRRIAAGLVPLPEEELPRRRAAGRVLARGLEATVDVPAADVSAMDGYALAGAAVPGERYPVSVTIPAGAAPGFDLQPPAVARIMTGAPVPARADRVIPVERSDGGAEEVAFTVAGEPGANLRRQGEVLRTGDPLLPAGALLTPGALALLATHGHAAVPVHRAPRVAILATGDEVVPPDRTPAPGQLRDSHTDFLLAAGASLGLDFEPLGIAPDDEEALAPLVERGLEADVFLLCGGVSMGEFDLVEGALAEAGCHFHFDAVAVQPGKPLVFATHRREGQGAGIVFGLPGNPASVMVSFWLFVRPALRRLLGSADGFWHGALAATAAIPLPGTGKRDQFLPAQAVPGPGGLAVTPCFPKGSHDLAAFARGNVLLRLPAGSEPRPAGAPCEVLPLADWRL
jgi:molybdopterin molybdotransferase